MAPKQNPDGTTELPRHDWSWRRALWPAYAKRLAASKKPIFIGPWRGETGFECLYWIPFVDKFLHQYGIDPARVVPISRGGAAAWYGAPQGMELYAMRTPQQLRVQAREEVAKTGVFKQVGWSDFDRQVVKDAAQTLGFQSYHVLHPSWMYHSLAPFWTGHTGIEWLGARARFRMLTPPPMELTLPKEFVAVRFYQRQTFNTSNKMTQKFVEAAIEQITADQEVVLLDHGLYLDDHNDLTLKIKAPRVHHLSDLIEITPENNLAVQSAALGHSLGFVGTYGGLAQLALRMGKPSVSLYVEWGNATSIAHRNLADALAVRMNIPSIVLRLAELPMLQTVLPQMSIEPQRTKSPLALQTA